MEFKIQEAAKSLQSKANGLLMRERKSATNKRDRKFIKWFRTFVSSSVLDTSSNTNSSVNRGRHIGGLGLPANYVDTEICDTLPKDLLTDEICVLMVNFMWKTITKEKLAATNINWVRTCISNSLSRTGKAVVLAECAEFGKTRTALANIRKTDYFKEYVSEQAPAPTDEDDNRILNLNLFEQVDDNGDIKRMWIFNKLVYQLRDLSFIRNKNAHGLFEEEVVLEIEPESDRLNLVVNTQGTNRQKHAAKNEVHGGGCICVDTDNPGKFVHKMTNPRCVITSYILYQTVKEDDKERYVKSSCKNYQKDISKLAFFRKFQFKPKPTWADDNFFSLNRIAGTKLSSALSWLNQKMELSIAKGTNPMANKNQRKKTFTGHSIKQGSIRKTETRHGSHLSDADRKALGGGSWGRYADKGNIQKMQLMNRLTNYRRNDEMKRAQNEKLIQHQVSLATHQSKCKDNPELPRQRTNVYVLDTSSNTNSSVNRGITLPTLRPLSSNVIGTSSMQSNSISHRNQMNVNLQRHSNENDRTIQPMALDTSNVQRHQSMQSNSHRNINNQMNVNQAIRGNPSPNLLCKNPPISAKDERLTQTISGATDPSRNVVTRVKQFKDEARHQMYTKSTAHAKGTKRSNPF
eukprot:260876_1